MKPQASICVSCYNSEQTIRQNVESILATTLPNRELIYIDDGSMDKTRKILKKYPINLIVQEHKGVAAGRQNALEHARGEFILFTDADTEVYPDWAEKLLLPFSDKTVGASTGKTIIKKSNTPAGLIRHYEKKERYSRLKRHTSFVRGYNFCVRADIMKNIRFHPSWYHGEAMEVGYTIRKAGYKIAYVPEALVSHVEEPSWKKLLRNRFRNGRGSIRAGLSHPARFAREDFFPFRMKCQLGIISLIVLLLLVLIPAMLIGFGTRTIAGLLFFFLSLYYIASLPLLFLMRSDLSLSNIIPIIILLPLKDAAAVLGMMYGLFFRQ